jgi:hypothetical protein
MNSNLVTIREAKSLFANSVINKFMVVITSDGYYLTFGHTVFNFPSPLHLVDNRNRKPRLFKSVDSVISTCREIGFLVNYLHYYPPQSDGG